MPLTILANPAREVLLREAVSRLIQFVKSASDSTLVCALTGGRTTGALFESLLLRSNEISPSSWKKLNFFMADERRVPLSDSESNFRLASELLLQPLVERGLIQSIQIFPPPVALEEAEKIAAEYGKSLDRVKGVVDIAILSSGEDGHIASLFPYHRELSASKTPDRHFVCFDDSPKPPPERMTISRPLLEGSTFVILLFIGEGKREAFSNFLRPDVSVEACPAKMVKDVPELLVLTDLMDLVP